MATQGGITVRRKNNTIEIHRMNHPKVVSDFIRAIISGLRYGYQDFRIVFINIKSAYPDVCAPIAGIVDYYRKHGFEFTFEFIGKEDYVTRAHIDSPLVVSENHNQLSRASLNDTWKFRNFEDVQNLVDAFVQAVSQLTVCEKGVLEGLTWCLNEVMDNVLQHSKVEYGYAMGQIHRSTKRIAFCVFDPGQGIYNSLKDTKHAPRHPIDAITLAVKEGVTRDTNIGQGNGMWGLHNIVKSNSGSLAITSNGASYMLRGNEIRTFPKVTYLSKSQGGTIVDFQIDFDKGISIAEALGGHTPVNLRTEILETEEGDLSYRLVEKASGTGTRQSGERIRNDLINLYNDSKAVIELDFEGISVISSSFADELIGKLVVNYGFFGFNQLFRLKNMNPIVQSIIDRSVAQRMSQSFVSG